MATMLYSTAYIDVLHTCRLALGTLGLGPKYHLGFVKADGRMMQEVARLLSTGELKAVIAKTFPLEEAAYVTCLLCALHCLHVSIDSVDLHQEQTPLWLFLQ